MKKILVLILIAVIVALSIFYRNYIVRKNEQEKILVLNQEILAKENEEFIMINDIITTMNKAIEINKKNDVERDSNNMFLENDTNSIKIYLETAKSETKNGEVQFVQIPMESLMLNAKAGPENVEYAFSDLKFKITEKEFHKKTGQIKKVVFSTNY